MNICTTSPFFGVRCGSKAPLTHNHTHYILLIFLAGFLFYGCQEEKAAQNNTAPEHQVSSVSDSASFSQQIKYAKGFSLEYRKGVKLLSIFNTLQKGRDTLRYVLVPKGKPVPLAYKKYQVIYTPIERLCVFSTTHIGLLSLLEKEDLVVGVARPQIINSPIIQQRLAEGKIVETGTAFSPNLEILLETNPDLVMVTAVPAIQYSKFQTLMEARIPVLFLAEWLEHSPLGRAEWAKIIAALTHQEKKMAQVFSHIETRYQRLSKLTDTLTHKPQVLTGLARKDSWFVPGGESYVARLIKDAGGVYHWNHKKVTGSLQLDIETVFPIALQAEYWLNTGTVTSMPDLLALDERFKEFQPVKNNRVYNNNKQLNAHGGNAYWEKGIVAPHLILEDMIRILHPELAFPELNPSREFHFYRKLN